MFPWYSGRGHQIGYRFWDARAQRNHTDCWISRATPTDVCGEKHSRCSVRWPGFHTVSLGYGSIFWQRYPGLAQGTGSSIVRARADVECLPAKHYPNESQVCSNWPALSKDPCDRVHS